MGKSAGAAFEDHRSMPTIRHIVLLALLIGCGVYAAEEDVPGLASGTVAPKLEGSVWVTKDGKAPELKGKVYLIDFWFVDCISCIHAAPVMKKLAADNAAKGLIVVGVALDAEEAVKKFKAEHELTYALLAGGEKTAEAYGVQSYPTLFLVGKDGKIVWKGQMEDDLFDKRLDEAVGAK
jgi:thiol-disulfide isomerase/thioredoxin